MAAQLAKKLWATRLALPARQGILVTLLYAMKHRGAAMVDKGLATLCIEAAATNIGCATIVEMD